MTRKLVASAAMLCTVLGPAVAGASGFLAARFGGEHGHPTTSSATALYYNPAGLALGAGTRVLLEGTFAYRSVEYVRPESAVGTILEPGELGFGTPREGLAANAGTAELSNFIASPFAAVVTDAGVPGLGLALGVFVPFGGQAAWSQNEDLSADLREAYPGAIDGVQRWATIEGTIRSLYFSAGGAYLIEGANLSAGVGLNLVSSEVNTVRGRNINGSDDLVVRTAEGDQLYEGRSWLDVSNTTFSIGGGLIWQPTSSLFIGASYQSQPGFGELTYEGTLDTALGTSPPTQTQVTFTQSLPDVFRLGGRYRAAGANGPAWEARLFGEYARWSVFDKQCILNDELEGSACEIAESGRLAPDGANVILNIPRNWDDAFGVRGGFSWWFQPELEAFVGAGWDGNAVPDGTIDASLLDMPKFTGSLGASYTMGDLELTGTYTHVFYLERDVPQEDVTDFESPSKNPSGAGVYNQSIDLLVVGLGYRF